MEFFRAHVFYKLTWITDMLGTLTHRGISYKHQHPSKLRDVFPPEQEIRTEFEIYTNPEDETKNHQKDYHWKPKRRTQFFQEYQVSPAFTPGGGGLDPESFQPSYHWDDDPGRFFSGGFKTVSEK
ncbi:hypothetical protein CEXT_192591 [Caerostris extrusa]|uniref:Uncharacterized protein n=1 Tax=Caerostris extrusa TaxID=172846 RepID=A0AAV4X7W7_CAEEX|nr:hypothetical protein CEXT_192591 [Caerostris extrusa]